MRLTPIGVLGVLAFVPASWALDEPPGAPSAKSRFAPGTPRGHSARAHAGPAGIPGSLPQGDDRRRTQEIGCVEARREEICRPHDGAGRVGPRRPRGR